MGTIMNERNETKTQKNGKQDEKHLWFLRKNKNKRLKKI